MKAIPLQMQIVYWLTEDRKLLICSLFWFTSHSVYFLTPSLFLSLAHTRLCQSSPHPSQSCVPVVSSPPLAFVSLHLVRNYRHSGERFKQVHMCVLKSERSLIKTAVPLSSDDTYKDVQGSKHAHTCKYVLSLQHAHTSLSNCASHLSDPKGRLCPLWRPVLCVDELFYLQVLTWVLV